MKKPNIKQIIAGVIEARKNEEFPGRERYPPCPRRIPQKELKMAEIPSDELVKIFYRDWKKPLEANTLTRFLKY